MEAREHIIRNYFDAWINSDSSILTSLFDDKISYIECHGPEYHGINQILRWFSDWHLKGNVIEWRIKQYIHQGQITVVEWYFKCNYEYDISGFDGVSIIMFNAKNEMTSIKEFQSKTEHYNPYE